MGYLSPRYDHDIFVSYAHVDNDPLPEAKKGWVTNLVTTLDKLLAKKLRPKPEFWRDYRLSGNELLTPAIFDHLNRSAVILAVLSPAYMDSQWCLDEKREFLDAIKGRFRDTSRVFVIEHDKLREDQQLPPEYSNLTKYRFWLQKEDRRTTSILGWPKPDPDERLYYERLTDLSHDLAEELKKLKRDEPRLGSGATVFLAHGTHDLTDQRDKVKRYFKQEGLGCLPVADYPLDPQKFQEHLDRDLAKCSRFVQMLSKEPGYIPPDLPQGYLALQYESAKAAGLPILQWRDENLALEKVKDGKHREFLQLETVQAVGIEEFKRTVRDYEPVKEKEPTVGVFVFVNADKDDRKLAQEVCELLERHGADSSLPVEAGTPGERRRDLEEHLEACDALVVIYGETTVVWVRRQLLKVNWAKSKRKSPLRALCLFQGPPFPKRDLGMRLQGLQILNCTEGLDEKAVVDFLKSVREEPS